MAVLKTQHVGFLHWCCDYSVFFRNKMFRATGRQNLVSKRFTKQTQNRVCGEAFNKIFCWVGFYLNLKCLQIMTHFRNSKKFFENITHMRHFLSYFSYYCDENQIFKLIVSGATQEYYNLLLHNVLLHQNINYYTVHLLTLLSFLSLFALLHF